MSRDSSVHQFCIMVRRYPPLSFRLRRGGDQLFVPFRRDVAVRGRRRRRPGYIPDPVARHRLPQVLPLSAQGSQEEKERGPERKSPPRESHAPQQRPDRKSLERPLQSRHAAGDVSGELREGQYLLTIRHCQYRDHRVNIAGFLKKKNTPTSLASSIHTSLPPNPSLLTIHLSRRERKRTTERVRIDDVSPRLIARAATKKRDKATKKKKRKETNIYAIIVLNSRRPIRRHLTKGERVTDCFEVSTTIHDLSRNDGLI